MAKEAAKAEVALNQTSVDDATKALGSSNGLVGPSIQALRPPEGVDLIKVSFDLSP